MAADIAGLLGRTHLLGSVPAADLERIAAVSRVRGYRRGQVVFTRDDPGDTVIVVISGRVKVAVRSADGGALTLAVIQPGGVFGEVVAADGGPRSSDAEILDDGELLLMPREAIQEVCARVPAAGQALTRSVAATLRRLTDSTADLIFLDLPRRVAKALLSQPRGQDGVLRYKMNQEELAQQAGGTRQSVNAALRGFERRGWIEARDRVITIRAAEAMARFADTGLSGS